MLTALYIEANCRQEQQLHSGRHHYALKRIGQDPEICRYHVTDEDGDTYNADIVYTERENLTVPLSITLRGFLTGRMVLLDP